MLTKIVVGNFRMHTNLNFFYMYSREGTIIKCRTIVLVPSHFYPMNAYCEKYAIGALNSDNDYCMLVSDRLVVPSYR